jgi:hypothetical protein
MVVLAHVLYKLSSSSKRTIDPLQHLVLVATCETADISMVLLKVTDSCKCLA